ncbi:hypothetical protein GGR55DRAFT_693511 [Xylaria sp. FL0064]|nr:hypothetical protein GGR55DRAFT_693511 [Xylaria sp. FL0064]
MEPPTLDAVIRHIEGFTFLEDTSATVPQDFQKVFTPPPLRPGASVSVEDFKAHFIDQLTTLLTTCLEHSTWDSPYALLALSIRRVLGIVAQARQRYLRQTLGTTKHEDDGITGLVDKFIDVIENVDRSQPTGTVTTLRPPGLFLEPVTGRPWPPRWFGGLDIAVLGEKRVREMLYGVDRNFPAKQEVKPKTPNDQSGPKDVRLHLSWLALVNQDDKSKVALFLIPVAFTAHKERQDCYRITVRESRYYATAHEFFSYAWNEIGGNSFKEHALALATPWFYDVEYVEREAIRRGLHFRVMWKRLCYRSGCGICVSKSKTQKHGLDEYEYRLVIFRPGPPMFPQAVERGEQRVKQDKWITDIIVIAKEHFRIAHTWVSEAAQIQGLSGSASQFDFDSVTASAVFITKLMKEHWKFPEDDQLLKQNGFIETVVSPASAGLQHPLD